MQKNISDMAEEIRLSKTDDQPWGFRVTGGLDFGTPVTVIKVTAGSLAEQAGLKVGDMLLQANGQPLSFLTHHEYTKFLLEAGNFIELFIVRGSLVLPPPLAPHEPTATEGTENNQLEESQNDDKTDVISNTKPLSPPEPSLFESIFGPLDVQDVKCPENIIQELKDEPIQQLETTTDDQTQNEENVTPVLQESVAAESTDTAISLQHPEAESQPLSQEHEVKEQAEQTVTDKQLSEEEVSDILVGRAEVLMGTTIGVDFDKLEPKTEVIEKSQVLQLLKEEENEPEKKKLSSFLQVPNRPKIKPKEKPKKTTEPPKQLEAQTENVIDQDVTEHEEEQQTTESDQPNTEQDTKEPQLTDNVQLEENELPEEQKEENEINTETVEKQEIEEPQKVNDDKLLDIQSQLTALLQLPVVMQQQLSFIQQQLTNIVQQKMEEMNPVSTAEDTDAEKEEVVTEIEEERAQNDDKQQEELQDGEEMETAGEGEKVAADTNQIAEGDQVVQEETDESAIVQENHITEPQNVEGDSSETKEETPKEERKRDIKWQKERPKRNKPHFPLTPHPRPIVLPRGIKFQMNPEEAYNDDFIAETLSGNAEVIKGTTIGVNFQKYQRSYDHLKSSSVYRMIHETEKSRPGAFEGRPEKLLALEDYKQVLQVEAEEAATPVIEELPTAKCRRTP